MTQAERKTITQRVIFNIHPASLLLSTGAVIAGLAASVIRGGIATMPALLTLLFAVCFQISGNLYYGYHRVLHSIEENKTEQRGIDVIGFRILKVLSNTFFILAVSVAFPLFTYIGWWSLLYLVATMEIVYLYFGGPCPLVRTRWSVLVTFLLFGPIAVSGTAFIQKTTFDDLTPIIAYSVISGVLAANANLALQFLRRIDDVKDGMTSLLAIRGSLMVRMIYMFDIMVACVIVLLPMSAVGFANGWIPYLVALFLFASGIYVYILMKRDSLEDAFRIRKIAIWQYIAVLFMMLCLVFYADESYWLTFFSRHY